MKGGNRNIANENSIFLNRENTVVCLLRFEYATLMQLSFLAFVKTADWKMCTAEMSKIEHIEFFFSYNEME